MSMDEYRERHILAVDRLRSLVAEETVAEQYLHYFQDVAIFFWSWRMCGARSTVGHGIITASKR